MTRIDNDTDRRQCPAVDQHGLSCAGLEGHEPPHANVNGEFGVSQEGLDAEWRADVEAIANRYGAVVTLDANPTVGQIRDLADKFRQSANDVDGWNGSARLHGVRWRNASAVCRAQADDLDALADRYEREAAR